MSDREADAELESRLAALKDKYGEKVPITELVEVVQDVLATLHGDLSSQDMHIYQEIESLVQYIHSAKEEIAALCPEEISAEHIPTATDELDAIVLATEEATGTILDTAEKLMEIGSGLEGEEGGKIVDGVTTIFEACNFQDITGQRIGKVVTALRHIEEKVEALAAAFGEDIKAAGAKLREEKEKEAKEKAGADKPSDEDLLHGPQMENEATSQEDIDALLDSFD
ncbi:MAG: protein phosphatase CheZ [Alphaproteobacteria bacterium]|nr:protein phosphatase CheZ [Alphaproteobacteria bacterium]